MNVNEYTNLTKTTNPKSDRLSLRKSKFAWTSNRCLGVKYMFKFSCRFLFEVLFPISNNHRCFKNTIILNNKIILNRFNLILSWKLP